MWPSSVTTTDLPGHVPELHFALGAGPVVEGAAAGRQELAVGREGDALDRPAEAGQPRFLRAGLDVPERDEVPLAGGGQQPAVGRERQLGDAVEALASRAGSRRSGHPRSGWCRPSRPRRAVVPSGEKATVATPRSCPSSVALTFRVATSQSVTVPGVSDGPSATARVLPSGE